MNESQNEDRCQRVGEEQDPQSHVVAKGRQDPFVRPDEGHPERKVGETARGVRGLEPRTSAPNRDEGNQPCIRRNSREDCRTRKVHRVAPSARTRRTVTVSEERHRHWVAPVSRSSAAERNPACRASASVRSERKARLASSMKSRPNSGPVSYRARTTWPTPGTVVPSDGRTTSRVIAFRRRSPSSTENVSSPRGRPRGSSPDRARRASIRSPDRPRDLEPTVLEEEGVVVAVLVHAPHLHALDAPLERGLGDRLESKVDDAVREEFLLQRGRRCLESGLLRDQQARDAEVPEPLEETERLGPAIVELEDELERVPRIDRKEPEVPPHAELEDLRLQDREEGLPPRGRRLRHRPDLCDHLLEVLAAATQVQDRKRLGDRGGLEAEPRDVFEEARRGLLERDVQARRAFERVVVQDVVREGRLHRPARAPHEDDVALRDPAAEHVLVEAADVRLHQGAGHRVSSGAHRSGDAEATLVEVHREVSGVVFRPPHLHDPQPTLRRRVCHEVHPEVDHAVREELLVPASLEHVTGHDPVRPFRDEEARDAEVAEPLEEPVDLPPSVFELREDLERLERVDDDQVEASLFLDGSDPLAEALEPVLLLAEEVRRAPRVEDDERPFRHLEVEAKRTHLLEEARTAFLEAQVEAMQAGTRRVLQEDRETQGRLHRPWRAFDEDDVAPRDPAFERLIQALDERAHAAGRLGGLRDDRGAASLGR